MWMKIAQEENPHQGEGLPQNPLLLVCLSTSIPQYRALYSHGRELGRYLMKNMKFEKVATLYASGLPPSVVISDEGIVRLVSVTIHRTKSLNGRDIFLVVGDSTPLDEEYEFAEFLLSYARDKLGVHDFISFGTRWTESVAPASSPPRITGFASDERGLEELKKNGVNILHDEPAPYFASLIVGLAERYDMTGIKLSVDHGEPTPHPRALVALIAILSKITGFAIGTDELHAKAAEMSEDLLTQGPAEPPPQPSGVYG